MANYHLGDLGVALALSAWFEGIETAAGGRVVLGHVTVCLTTLCSHG